MRKLTFLLLIAPILISAQPPQGGRGGGRGPAAPSNLMILPANTTFQQILPIMETFEASLGVQCGYCHVQGNFAADDNMRKNAARAMMRIVGDFNKKFPDGKQHIGCWTCHRGSTMPDITPPQNLLDEAAKNAPGGGGRGGAGAAPAPQK